MKLLEKYFLRVEEMVNAMKGLGEKIEEPFFSSENLEISA
jgi:hypothetical protein